MASKLKFDTPKEEPRRAPAGPPSVPISRGYDDIRETAVAPPISSGNLDQKTLRTLKFDAPTAEQKSAERVRQIAGKLRGGEKLPPGPLDTITDAFSLGTTRPLSAAITAGIAKAKGDYPDASLGETYQALIQYMNDRQARGDENTGPLAPLVRGIASTPATMATGGGSATAKAITQGTAAAPRVVAGAATNPVTAGVRSSIPATTTETAARAAVPGFIEGASQNAESLPKAIEGGTKNAVLSAGGAAVLDKGMKKFMPAAGRAAEAEAAAQRGKTPDEIIKEAKGHYDVLDNNGIAYSAPQTANLYAGLHQLRNNSTYVPGGNAAMDTLFGDLMTKSRQGMTFNELDNARSAIARLARGPDETTRVSARAINNEIDRMIGSGPPAVNPNNVNVQENYEKARGLWRQKALVEDAMFHADNVDRKLAINSDANPNKAMKAEFGAVEKQYAKPGAYDPLAGDTEGRDMLSRIVRGGPAQNTMAAVGNTLSNKYSTWAGGSAGLAIPHLFGVSQNVDPVTHAALAGAAGAATGGAVNQAGKAFQRGAANLGEEDVNAYLRHLSGSPAPVPGAAIDRNDLAQMLFAQDLERLVPRVGSAAIGGKTEDPDKPKRVYITKDQSP